MSKKKADFSRRDFLKTAGAVGLGSMLSPIENLTYARGLYAANEPQQNIVPTRPFGKTGVDVPILSLGGGFRGSNMLLMKQAVKLGVTYWDTAVGYGGRRCRIRRRGERSGRLFWRPEFHAGFWDYEAAPDGRPIRYLQLLHR